MRLSDNWACWNCAHRNKCKTECEEKELEFSEFGYCTSYEDVDDLEYEKPNDLADW